MKNILMSAVLCLAAVTAFGAPPAGQPYTEGKYFSVIFPPGWVKKDEALGLSEPQKKYYGVEFFGPVTGGLAVKIAAHYYAPGNQLYATAEKFIQLHSKPAIKVNLDGKVYGKVKSGRAGKYYAKVFERKVYEYLPAGALHPQKIHIYEKFAVVPVKHGFFVLRYYAPMSIAKADIKAYSSVLSSFKPLLR